jgi:hypothetical protein
LQIIKSAVDILNENSRKRGAITSLMLFFEELENKAI